MSTTNEYYEMVSELVDHLDDMNDWEYDFVNNLAEYEEQGRLFTTVQKAKIDELYTRYCN